MLMYEKTIYWFVRVVEKLQVFFLETFSDSDVNVLNYFIHPYTSLPSEKTGHLKYILSVPQSVISIRVSFFSIKTDKNLFWLIFQGNIGKIILKNKITYARTLRSTG